jgi:hypothetical protein
MKLFSNLSLTRGIGYLLVITLCVNCKKDNISTKPSQLPSSESILRPGGENLAVVGLSQTKTGSLFNNWGEAIANYWLQASAQNFSADDNSYAYSKKLSRARNQLPLLLQDFRFEIPSNATIDRIVVVARRFKQGKGSITDYFATLIRRFDNNDKNHYGVHFTNSNFYPSTETEVVYSQNGTDINGGFEGNISYQWTPAMINDPAFGVRIDNARPSGSVVVYYDLVEITVEYSLP